MQRNIIFQLIGAIPAPVLVISPTAEVMATNARLDQLLGDGLVGRHFITALRQPTLIETVELVLRERRPATGRFLGREEDRDTTYRVEIAPAGEATLLTFEDLTHAETIERFRRDFVANVSHELRTPLTALLGFIETLRGAARDDAEARERFLATMEREAQRMTRLVDDLLNLSRVEENERVRPTAPVEIGALVRSTLDDMGSVIDASGRDVRVEDAAGGATVPGDAAQLRQLIMNLTENALKYGAAGTPVTIALTAPATLPELRRDGVALSVHNEGDGIAAHHIPRLTERFYRVDTHRSRAVGGTGLGLAIVKHIVNRHRGRMRIDSAPGQGVTVRISLPVQDG